MKAPLASMTGFARAERAFGAHRLRVEIKSVNGRGLDIRMRLAPGLDALDMPLRQILGKALQRGSVSVNVMLDRTGVSGGLRLDPLALDGVMAALAALADRLPAVPPRPEAILAIPGVLVADDGADLDEAELAEAVLEAAAAATDMLVAARRQEGAAIATLLRGHFDRIEALTARARVHPFRSRAAIGEKLRDQLAALAADIALPPERLAQEALLLATRADIEEEIGRLDAHVAAGRALLDGGGAVGRRLDFLAQEFNREANTLCSKANAVELTAIGLDLKAAIDQLREQVQNIE